MARPKKTTPPPAADAFDVPEPGTELQDSSVKVQAPAPEPEVITAAAPPVEREAEEDDDAPEETKPAPVPATESPEQRRLMRLKRIAKAEEEQLRRLTRQYPVIARLVAELTALKKQLAQRNPSSLRSDATR